VNRSQALTFAKSEGSARSSLRLRLTAVATALLATAIALFGTLVYAVSARTLDLEVDRALADRASVVIAGITVARTASGLQVQLPDVDAIAAGGAVVQVTGFDGTIVRSALLGNATLPLSDSARSAALAGASSFETTLVDGVRLRIASAPLAWRGETLGVLLVARPLLATDLVTGGLRLVLTATGGLVLLIGAAGSWVVTRRALRPLDDFAREAGAIGQAQDFSRRLTPEVMASVAEVGTLGATFNAMLDRLEQAFGAMIALNRRLEATLASQRRFIADASHELRTPLTTIRGNAQLLQRASMHRLAHDPARIQNRPPTEEACFEPAHAPSISETDRAEMVAQVASEAERMARLVNDLLTLARADSGQPLGALQPVMLRPLLESVAVQARTLSGGQHGPAVSVVPFTGDGDLEVDGDPDALRQLLLALVDNAVKYTPAGGSVTLALSDGVARGTRVCVARLSVIDTGIGIAPDDLPHVFERFYRADRARTVAGSGLGLSIARWIAESHGGGIAVESSVGAGSMFTVTLPARLVGQHTAFRDDAECVDDAAFRDDADSVHW
jgi:signal transduction histidine kinase